MEVFALVAQFIAGLFAALIGLVSPVVTYAAAPFTQEPARAELLFVGDIMLDRTIRATIDEKGGDFIFSCIDPILQSADVVVANLEGPVTTHPSKSLGSVIRSPENFTFTFATSTAQLLRAHNISIVNIGNNHILNFGNEGVVQTREWLTKAGVRYFGDPLVSDESARVVRTEIGRIPFSFVSWSEWTGGTLMEVLSQIRAEAQTGRMVIVYTHWGEEYLPATEREKSLARQFVDAGAEAVIGSHPHVVQEHELYGGKHIYYSLGNFIFDQYWREEVRTGLLVRLSFGREGVISHEEIAVELGRDRRTCPITQEL